MYTILKRVEKNRHLTLHNFTCLGFFYMICIYQFISRSLKNTIDHKSE